MALTEGLASRPVIPTAVNTANDYSNRTNNMDACSHLKIVPPDSHMGMNEKSVDSIIVYPLTSIILQIKRNVQSCRESGRGAQRIEKKLRTDVTHFEYEDYHLLSKRSIKTDCLLNILKIALWAAAGKEYFHRKRKHRTCRPLCRHFFYNRETP